MFNLSRLALSKTNLLLLVCLLADFTGYLLERVIFFCEMVPKSELSLDHLLLGLNSLGKISVILFQIRLESNSRELCELTDRVLFYIEKNAEYLALLSLKMTILTDLILQLFHLL